MTAVNVFIRRCQLKTDKNRLAEESKSVRGGETLATMTVELDLERMEKMKQQVLKTIQRIIDEYGNVPVIELELALIEGLAKVREIGMKQTEEEDESVV
jgi:hypothetical protein